jgi:hypothetical protein
MQQQILIGCLISNESEILWKRSVMTGFKYYLGIFLKWLKKNSKNLSEESWYPGQNLI